MSDGSRGVFHERAKHTRCEFVSNDWRMDDDQKREFTTFRLTTKREGKLIADILVAAVLAFLACVLLAG